MTSTLEARIAAFLDGAAFAVVGASADRRKYGNIVFRACRDAGLRVFPVNPRGGTIEGVPVIRRLAELPEPVHGISVVTPPAVTERIVDEAAAASIDHVWMQPGAQSPRAVERCRAHGIACIAGDACILVVLAARRTRVR